MKKISLSKSKKNGDNKTNLLHGVQDSILVGSREQGGGISSLKNPQILTQSQVFTNLDTINRDRGLDNSVSGHSCAEVSGQDGKVSPSHHLL